LRLWTIPPCDENGIAVTDSVFMQLRLQWRNNRQVKLKSEIPLIMLRNFAPIAKFRIFLKFA
jgi:hypothetical protein